MAIETTIALYDLHMFLGCQRGSGWVLLGGLDGVNLHWLRARASVAMVVIVPLVVVTT